MADQEHKDRPMQLLWDKTPPQYSGFVNSGKGGYQVGRDALHNSHKEIGGIRHAQENTVLSTKLQQNSNEQWNKALANVRLRIDMPGRVSLEPTSGKMMVDRLPSPIIRKTPSSLRSISNPTKIILKNPITSPIYPSMNPLGQTSRQARKWEFQEYQQRRDQQVQAKDNDGPDRDGRWLKRISLYPGSMQSHPITLSARSGSAVEDVDGLFGTSGLSDEPDLASDRKTSERKLRSGYPRSRHDRPPGVPPVSHSLVPPPLPGQFRGISPPPMIRPLQGPDPGKKSPRIGGRRSRHHRPPGVPPVSHSEVPPPLPGQFRGIPPPRMIRPLPGQGSGPGPGPWPLGTFEHKRDRSTMEQILEALPPRNVSAGSSSSGWNRDADNQLMAARARKKICISSYTISEDLSGDCDDLILSRISEKKRDGNFRFRKECSYIGHQSLRHRGET